MCQNIIFPEKNRMLYVTLIQYILNIFFAFLLYD